MNVERYNTELQELKAAGNLRKLPKVIPVDYINLSSNDYLGLTSDESLVQEFYSEHGIQQKMSAASSRLLTGNSNAYHTLENTLMQAYQREACLIYNSGYHANTGILPALAGKKDLIIADKLVHASIIDGMQLSKADIARYRHLDYTHLEKILHNKRDKYENVFIVSESIFSMDGDCANLPELVRIKKQHKCFLYIDEAHAVGACGQNGLGMLEAENLIQECDFIVGTFGKALTSIGAFVVCSQVFKNYLVNKSRTLIFTTALPPINLAWTNFIFRYQKKLSDKREQLRKLSFTFAANLGKSGESHILPYITGNNESALTLSDYLGENKIHALPVRYPTVPKNTARIRFSLHAALSEEDLKNVARIVKNYDIEVDK